MKKTKKLGLISALLLIALVAALLIGRWAGQNDQTDVLPGESIRNIIVMIPDGAGFGSFDMADAVKRAGQGVAGLESKITTQTVSGETSEGLYLADYLIGTSKTRSADSKVTDSAAGGTAIATGNKTNNDMVSISPQTGAPMATLLEASQLAGKSTGIVCTKFWYDATPASFTAHAVSRKDYDQITAQMLHRGLDVVLGGGAATGYDTELAAADLGYTLVHDRAELERAVADGETKIWSNFSDVVGDSLAFDYMIGTENPGQPTILDMTKAAIAVLSENSGNEDGFFLMVEGSRVDSGGHNSNALQAVSEYLAFDEAFAYAVNWAKEDGHTLVVAVPDHDTGGLTPEDEGAAIRSIGAGMAPENCTWAGEGDHTGQNVPLCAYGPAWAMESLRKTLGLPGDGAQEARTGKYYAGVQFKGAYAVENTALAHAVAKLAGFDLTQVTETLFVDITKLGMYENGVFTAAETGICIPAYDTYYLNSDGTRTEFPHGISVWVGDRFYVPREIADLCTRK